MTMGKVYRQSAIVIIPLAVASAFIEPVKLPLGIVAGALLAAINFRGMTKNLQNLLGTERPTVKLVFLSVVRLTVVFAVIIALAALKLVNLMGLMAGFTIVLVIVVKEGYVASQAQ